MNHASQNERSAIAVPTVAGHTLSVAIVDGAVHVVTSDGRTDVMLPADARRLSALLLSAAFALDEPGAIADMESLVSMVIEKVRREDAMRMALQSMGPGSSKH